MVQLRAQLSSSLPLVNGGGLLLDVPTGDEARSTDSQKNEKHKNVCTLQEKGRIQHCKALYLDLRPSPVLNVSPGED